MECPGGGGHGGGRGNPVSAVVVDTGALWRNLGLSQFHQGEEKTRQTTYRLHAVREYCLSRA